MSGYIFVLLAILFAVSLFGLVFYGANTLLKEMNRERHEQAKEPSRTALDMLDQRYAKGEIDEEEFQRKKTEIEEASREIDE
ncbi:MAG: SHOCT domain-containing protein [Candidatus Aquicultorales bacterium]